MDYSITYLKSLHWKLLELCEKGCEIFHVKEVKIRKADSKNRMFVNTNLGRLKQANVKFMQHYNLKKNRK